MSVRALITGGNGFVARWAIRAMLEHGWNVTAGGIGAPPPVDVLSADERQAVTWLSTDITKQRDVAAAVHAASADVILHLAAISHVPQAADDPGHAYDVNVVGTVRLLTEVRAQRAAGTEGPLVLIVGSAEEYGRHDARELPLRESAELRPLTPYAASKVAQEVAALQSWRAEGVRVVCTRSFSHSGVGHAPHFLLPSLVSRALALAETGDGTLQVGNGDTVRDFLHVRDTVEAYLALLQHGTAGEIYNVCSGEGVSVRALAESVLQRVGVRARITSDATLTRPVDVPVQIGDNARLRRATGWSPRLTRDDIIDDLIHAATH